METLLEAGRHALEGIEVLFAFATAATLGLGLVTAHHAARHSAGEPPAAPGALHDAPQDPLNRAA
jgi:hypothetical protein